jgi:hypothetical protein
MHVSRPGRVSRKLVAQATSNQETPRMNVTTIGLDLAKSVFQVHGIGYPGKTLTRAPRGHLEKPVADERSM